MLYIHQLLYRQLSHQGVTQIFANPTNGPGTIAGSNPQAHSFATCCSLKIKAVLQSAVKILPTCRVGDEQPISMCGIAGRAAVKFVGRSRDVASCQLDT